MKEIVALTAFLCLFGGCKEKDKAPDVQAQPAAEAVVSGAPAAAQTLPAEPAQAAPADPKAAVPAAPACDCKCGDKKSKKSKN